MTVNEFVGAATALGWECIQTSVCYTSFPFCTSLPIDVVRMRSTSQDGYTENHYLYVPKPTVAYTKRYLTEVRKHNESVFRRLPETKDCKGLIDVMRYCT
jgi:hypothetical protein